VFAAGLSLASSCSSLAVALARWLMRFFVSMSTSARVRPSSSIKKRGS